MNHTVRNDLRAGAPTAPLRHVAMLASPPLRTRDGLAVPPSPPPRANTPPSATRALGLVRAALIGAGFAGISLIMRAAVRVYFARVRVRHRERFPTRGPVLLVANHPAMWTDVLVLDVALGRKLQFLAQGALFRPRLRAAILRLHGALPITPATEGDDARTRNAETFRRCHDLFARGSVVALFPEGVSHADRSVLQLKTGAARIALAECTAPAPLRVPLIPAGIHYANRTAFGSAVTVTVGEPIALAPYGAIARSDPELAVHELTEHMHRALRALILDLPEPTLAAAVADLVPLAALSARTGTWELGSAQRIAARLDLLRTSEPARFAAVQRHTRRYRRARRALGLSDRALLWARGTTPWRQRLSLLTGMSVLGAPIGLAGAILHAVPWAAGELVAHRVGVDPVRFSFARIACGIVFFPAMYAIALAVLAHQRGLDAPGAFAALAVFVALGLWTLAWSRWVRALGERVRLLWLERRQPRLVRRARHEQRSLLELLAQIRAESAASGETAP